MLLNYNDRHHVFRDVIVPVIDATPHRPVIPCNRMVAPQRISRLSPAGCVISASVWVVSVGDMIPKPPCSTAWMACASLHLLPSRMCSVLMAILGGRGGQRRSGAGAVCRKLAPWKVSQEKAIGILVGTG